MRLPQFVTILLSLIILIPISCTNNSVDGGSGTDIVCQVFDSKYNGIGNAKVIIRPSNYKPGIDNIDTIFTFEGTTDKNGKLTIEKLDLENLLDDYTISIISLDSAGCIRTINFSDNRHFSTISNTSKTFRDFVLTSNGKISGHIVNGEENKVTNRALAFIPGTEFSDTTDTTGYYALNNIPTQFEKLSFLDLDTIGNEISIEEIKIISNKENYLDTVSLKGVVILQLQNNFSHRLDTLYKTGDVKQTSYLSIGGNKTIKTLPLYNNFQFVNWEVIYGSAIILTDSLDSTNVIVDSNSIIQANYKDIEGPDSIENINIDVKGNQVTFTWSPTIDNDTVKEYCIIYRYQSDSSIIDTFLYYDTIAFFEGLSYENATYVCTLKALDPSGNSSKSTILSFKTEKNDSTPPVFNSSIMIQKLNATYATVFWNPAVDGLGIRKYEILINDEYQTYRTECFYSGEGLTPGDTFNVKVRAYDYYDNISNWIETDVIMPLDNDTIAPTVPLIDSSSVNGQEIYFSWTASTDNLSNTVTYEIKYQPKDNSSVTPVYINLSNATEYKITGLQSSTTYNVEVRAYDLAWYFSDASTIEVTTE